MKKSNRKGLSAKSPSDYFINSDLIDYIIKTKKINRKTEKIAWHEKIDLIIDISDTEPILLTNTENDDIPYIQIKNDDKEAVEALLQYFYKKGYRRFR